MDQGITEHISIAEVIQSDMTELKQRVDRLVEQSRLTENQASELMLIRKRGKNKNAAKNSRKKKDAEIDELKKAVKEAERKQKPVAKEQRDLLVEKSFWEDKLATLTHFLLISHRMDPDTYQVVVDKGEVLFSLRDAVAGHGIMEEEMSEEREGRDERIARERGLNIFISVNDIINIQYDEFTECLERYKVCMKCLFEINPSLIQIKQGGVPFSSLLGQGQNDRGKGQVCSSSINHNCIFSS